MGTIDSPYALKGLSEEESFSLFKKMAFEPGQEYKNPELVNIGREIVKKCANVPLAIQTLGSLLYGKGENKWLNVKDKSLAHIYERGNGLLVILKLSYRHLWSPLKNCFAYCALFPKDYELDKEILINLWIAQGFVIPANESQSLEDAGEDYFLTLLQRCFFQDIRKDEWGNIKSCKMHDLVHDLALEVAGIECKVAELEEMKFDHRIHHLSFSYSFVSIAENPKQCSEFEAFEDISFVPEQIKDGSIFSKSVCHKLLSNYQCLRVLDLHNLGVKNLPSSIGQLIHLRYLNLSMTPIRALPESITKLQNLKTLELYACHRLERLPTDIGKLTNLRCLDVGECDLTYMPSGIGILTSLHKLNFLLVNNESPVSRRNPTNAQLRNLKNLNRLRGVLHIKIRGELNNPSYEAKEANLSSKHGLTELCICFSECYSTRGNEHDEAVSEGLKPHPNLKKLVIKSYGGEKLPSWARLDNLSTILRNLVEIEFEDCRRCQEVPSFGQLPFLKRLSLVKLESVEYMENGPQEVPSLQEEALFFPCLQELTLKLMGNLKGWWKDTEESVTDDDQTDIPVKLVKLQHQSRKSFLNLSKLHIRMCPNLMSLPLCPNVEDLKLDRVNETLLVLKVAADSAISFDHTRTSSDYSSKLKTLCSDVKYLISLPKECLLHLSSLELRDRKLLNTTRLVEVFRSLNSLRFLKFHDCTSLGSISRGLEHLTALEKLAIEYGDELVLLPSDDTEDGMPWKALNNLQYLKLEYLPKLVALPDGFKHLTNLRSLHLESNRNLSALPEWISCLSSLEQMELRCCSELTSLPGEICKLTRLKKLEIVECPGLTTRCRSPTGKDWHNIQHIPLLIVKENIYD